MIWAKRAFLALKAMSEKHKTQPGYMDKWIREAPKYYQD
jgi:hypothetical protein